MFFLLSFIIFSALPTTAKPHQTDFANATQTLIDFSLAIEDSPSTQHKVWFSLFAPVCETFFDQEEYEPLAEPPLMSPAQQRACDLLLAYEQQQESLPLAVHDACDVINDQCYQLRRGPESGNRTFNAAAVTQRAVKSEEIKNARRYTTTEHKRQQRFRREENARKRDAKKALNHNQLQAGRATHHNAARIHRDNVRYQKQSKELAEKMQTSKREKAEKERIHAEHTAAVNAKEAARKQKMEDAIINMLNNNGK